MKTIAYLRMTSQESFNQQQHQQLLLQNPDLLYIEPYHLSQPADMELKKLSAILEAGDLLLVYRLDCLGKKLNEYYKFLQELQQREIQFCSLADQIDTRLPEQKGLLKAAQMFVKMDERVTTERGIRGSERILQRGKGSSGRPPLSQQKINEIYHLYFNEGCSLRQISRRCGVSIGSASKYIHIFFKKHPGDKPTKMDPPHST